LASWRIARRLFPPPKYPTVEELEKQGLIEVREFSARRAFQVYEFEDEGPAYFVELEDGRVLYLCGQYLDDVVEITDDPESNQPALFPCARFRLRTRKDTGGGIGLEPLSPFFGVDAEFPPFTHKDFKAGWIPSDGQILSESYDALKERLASRK
jgi:hypothetical protein